MMHLPVEKYVTLAKYVRHYLLNYQHFHSKCCQLLSMVKCEGIILLLDALNVQVWSMLSRYWAVNNWIYFKL